MDVLAQVFPGIATLFVEDPILGVVRVGLTILGFVLAYLRPRLTVLRQREI